ARADVGDPRAGTDAEEREHAVGLLPLVALRLEAAIDVEGTRRDPDVDVERCAVALDAHREVGVGARAPDTLGDVARDAYRMRPHRANEVAGAEARRGRRTVRQDRLDPNRRRAGVGSFAERDPDPT